MNTDEQPEASVNPGYAANQLAKAISSQQSHADAAVRKRAVTKVAKWNKILQQMASGTLNVGTRLPVRNVPAWVTLDVVTGGFATGDLKAAGPLQQHERALLDMIGRTAKLSVARSRINLHYLTDEGIASLRDMLRTGCYLVNVPEEAALLVVVALVDAGLHDQAFELLNTIEPFFGQLRFYPVPVEHVSDRGDRFCVTTVSEVKATLRNKSEKSQILAQKEALTVWLPLYDQFVELVLETAGDSGVNKVEEKLFSSIPDDWFDRGKALLETYQSLRAKYKRCAKPDKRRENFYVLRQIVARFCESKTISDSDFYRAKNVVQRDIAKRGLPNSIERVALRSEQARVGDIPTYRQISSVIIERLEAYDQHNGIAKPESVSGNVSDQEATDDVPSGTAIPDSLMRTVRRCIEANVAELVQLGLIQSGDVLAKIVPQITSRVAARSFGDESLGRLYRAVYQAFRCRRSLLLVNYQKQVQFDELPWARELMKMRQRDASVQQASQDALAEVARLTLKSFPHAIVPNKLLQELRALAGAAGLKLPFVDEIAADIFMGSFTEKYLAAARIAHKQLEGSLYANYYSLDLGKLPEQGRGRIARGFGELCSSRANPRSKSYSVASNGLVIEQQQILTTQNLAVLFQIGGVKESLSDDLMGMSKDCFLWICKRTSMSQPGWHSALIAIKRCAYAWRQMVFFISHLNVDQQVEFLEWSKDVLQEQYGTISERLLPALRGLECAQQGKPVSSDPRAKLFLGWTTKRHWLMLEPVK